MTTELALALQSVRARFGQFADHVHARIERLADPAAAAAPIVANAARLASLGATSGQIEVILAVNLLNLVCLPPPPDLTADAWSALETLGLDKARPPLVAEPRPKRPKPGRAGRAAPSVLSAPSAPLR